MGTSPPENGGVGADGVGDDERAASSVVGVILLVAVTIIVGAVVAGFVFDLGRNSTQSTPSAQLDVQDAEPILSDGTNGEDVLVINHDSGDELETADIQLRISQDGTTYYQGVLGQSEFETTESDYDTLNSDAGSDFEAAMSITLSENSNGAFDPGTYSVVLIHEPSDAILLEESVKVD